jgi:hypothetical protein
VANLALMLFLKPYRYFWQVFCRIVFPEILVSGFIILSSSNFVKVKSVLWNDCFVSICVIFWVARIQKVLGLCYMFQELLDLWQGVIHACCWNCCEQRIVDILTHLAPNVLSNPWMMLHYFICICRNFIKWRFFVRRCCFQSSTNPIRRGSEKRILRTYDFVTNVGPLLVWKPDHRSKYHSIQAIVWHYDSSRDSVIKVCDNQFQQFYGCKINSLESWYCLKMCHFQGSTNPRSHGS